MTVRPARVAGRDELLEAMRRAREGGASFAQIGELVNASSEAVRLWLAGRSTPSELCRARAAPWLRAGAPVPEVHRSKARPLPSRAELKAALEEAGSIAELGRRGTLGVRSVRLLTAWCRALNVTFRGATSPAKFTTLSKHYCTTLRRIHLVSFYDPQFIEQAHAHGHIDADGRITEAGALLLLRIEDRRWMQGEVHEVATSPQEVSNCRLHKSAARRLAAHGIINFTGRKTAVLTDFGRKLLEQFPAPVPEIPLVRKVSKELQALGWDVE